MSNWRSTFDALEANQDKPEAAAACEWISATIASAFDIAKRRPLMPALDGSDSCERVAEALAVWLKESAPRAFADMTGTRYSVTGVDDSADGMERLRSQSEFILLAYASGGEEPAEIAEQWTRDLESTDRGDGFSYEAAESAIREYCEQATESGYLAALIGRARDVATAEADESTEEMESTTLRLYVRDNAPESD